MSVDDIEALVSAFEAHSLPHAEWTHAAHLTVATTYVARDPNTALDETRRRIQSFNNSLGIEVTPTGGYHETITVFFIHMIRWHLEALDPSLHLPDKVAAVTAALGDRKIMLDYYSRDLVMSWEARTTWVEPDLQPLPKLGR